MNSNEFSKQVLNKWVACVNFCSLIMSIVLLIINFNFLVVKYINEEITLMNIILILIFTCFSFLLCLFSYLYTNFSKNEKKEYIINLIFLLICSIQTLYYPNYSILILLPTLPLITSIIFKNHKIIFSLYLYNVFLTILTFVRGDESQIFDLLITLTIITIIFKVCFEVNKILILSNKFIRDICQKQNYLEKDLEIEPFTKLFNKKTLYKYLENVSEEIQKNDIMPCVVMLDLDYFKKINDTYGHIKGDEALLSLTKMIKKKLPKGSSAFRFGGEEFVMLIKNIELKKVYDIIEDMRKEFSNMKHKCINNENITFSAGISSYEYKKDIYEWIKEADEALYKAKNQGRNKTIIYERQMSL